MNPTPTQVRRIVELCNRLLDGYTHPYETRQEADRLLRALLVVDGDRPGANRPDLEADDELVEWLKVIKAGRARVCRLCDEFTKHRGRGLCHNCYNRMWRADRLDEFARVPKPGRKPKPIRHGSFLGWHAEQRRGLPHCDPCVKAARREWKLKRGTRKWREYQRRYQRQWRARAS